MIYLGKKKIKWAERISNYQGKRNETIDYYTILYNSEKIAMEKMKEKSDRISGEKIRGLTMVVNIHLFLKGL